MGRRVIKPFLCFTIWFLFAFLSYAQKSTPATNSALTNSDVLKMVEAKLGNEVIVSKIRASTCDFDTSIETILKLKNAGVSDVVIQAMVEAGGATKSQVKDHVPLNPDDSKPQPTPTAQERPRVYLVDRDEWKLSGGFAATETSSVGSIHAGVRRDYTEILKTFAQACPQVTFTDDRTKADYAIVLDHKTWMETSWTGHENEFVIFNRAGDLSYSGATDKMKKAAKDSCKAVLGASKK